MKRVIAAAEYVLGLAVLVAFSGEVGIGQSPPAIQEAVPTATKPIPPTQKSAAAAATADSGEEPSGDRWMLAKRHHAHEIFSGLTDGDFERISNGGRRMVVTGILEKWLGDNEFAKRSDYRGQLNAFEFANKELIRHAEARDIDGALGAYVRLSQSCVRCHKLIRDAGIPAAVK